MLSINPAINALHQAFCEATGRALPLNPAFERWWFDALRYDITPAMVRTVMASRMSREYSSPTLRFHCLSLKCLIGDDQRLAQFVDEAAQLAALRRKKLFAPGKAQALRATGRADEPEPARARHVGEIFENMRRETA